MSPCSGSQLFFLSLSLSRHGNALWLDQITMKFSDRKELSPVPFLRPHLTSIRTILYACWSVFKNHNDLCYNFSFEQEENGWLELLLRSRNHSQAGSSKKKGTNKHITELCSYYYVHAFKDDRERSKERILSRACRKIILFFHHSYVQYCYESRRHVAVSLFPGIPWYNFYSTIYKKHAQIGLSAALFYSSSNS